MRLVAWPVRAGAVPPLIHALIAIGATLCAITLLDLKSAPTPLVNSDTLLPISYVWDVVHRAGGWRTHELPRIPSFVPDMPLVGVLLFATGSQRWTFLLYGALQFLAFIYAGGWLASRLSGRSVTAGAAMLFALAILLAALDLATGGVPVLMTAFEPVTHFGPFLFSLIAAGLAVRQLAEPDWRNLVGLAAVATLVFLGDRLLIVEFVAPLAAACVLFELSGRLPRSRVFAFAGATVGGVAVGFAVFAVLRQLGMHFEGRPSLRPGNLLKAVLAFARDLPGFVADHPVALALGCLLPLAAFAATPFLIARDARSDPATSQARAFLWCYAGLAMAGAMVFTACFYEDVFSFRFLIAFWTWPLIFLAAGLLRPGIGARTAPAATALGCAACVAGYAVLAGGPTALLRRDNDIATCVRALHEPLGLHEGLADYWNSRSVMAALDWSVQIDQVTDTGAAYFWGNDPEWYRSSLADPTRPPHYDFIVLRKLDPDLIRSAYGPPASVEPCSDTTIWIYRDAPGLYPKLVAISPALRTP